MMDKNSDLVRTLINLKQKGKLTTKSVIFRNKQTWTKLPVFKIRPTWIIP